jgi:hypothetical protein
MHRNSASNWHQHVLCIQVIGGNSSRKRFRLAVNCTSSVEFNVLAGTDIFDFGRLISGYQCV